MTAEQNVDDTLQQAWKEMKDPTNTKFQIKEGLWYRNDVN